MSGFNYKLKPFFLHFAKLGDWDSLDYHYDTLEEAKHQLSMLTESTEEYFGFIAKVIVAVRKPRIDTQEQVIKEYESYVKKTRGED